MKLNMSLITYLKPTSVLGFFYTAEQDKDTTLNDISDLRTGAQAFA